MGQPPPQKTLGHGSYRKTHLHAFGVVFNFRQT